MKRIFRYSLLLHILCTIPFYSQGQIIEKAEELINTTLGKEKNSASGDSVLTNTLFQDSVRRDDSIRLAALELQIQDMKLNEMLLQLSLDEAMNKNFLDDSLKMAEKRRQIDSLRAMTTGVPIIVNKDTLFTIYAKRGGKTPHERAESVKEIILNIGRSYSLKMEPLQVLESEYFSDIMYGDEVVFSVTEQDALWQNTTHAALAEEYIPAISNKIIELRKEYNLLQVFKRIGLLLLVVVAQFYLFKLTNKLFRKLRRRIIRLRQNKLKPVVIRDYEFLNTRRQSLIIIFFSNLCRYIVLLLQLMISIPIIFSIFPQTENLAIKLFGYLLTPTKMVVKSMIEYIPNLFIIIVIFICVRYIIKGLRYVSLEIESQKLKITGFYPDWAMSTFNIIRFLLYAFMIAMIYPYLPGANSGVFQGISVFIGLIVSLGSTTVIGNIMAGLVITYMRPFKIGDRIKLNDTIGNVLEKTPLVTRIRTPKNEIVTIPNSFIMSSHTTNYSASARNYGLIIHTAVTFGYEIHWRKVHEILISAALRTNGVQARPKPFVLDVELQDQSPCYQINAYVKDANQLPRIYSDLNQNIKDVANEAGIELLSPHYLFTKEEDGMFIPPVFKMKAANMTEDNTPPVKE